MSGADLRHRFGAIRQHYRAANPALMAEADEWGIDPYAWESIGAIKLTPIEQALWFDIRMVDAVLYPQYPVGPYFVDFGNPAARVAIECDGARWHTDFKRDAARQSHIEAWRWSVYRISGRDCFTGSGEARDSGEPQEGDGAAISAARQFVLDICARHPIRRGGA